MFLSLTFAAALVFQGEPVRFEFAKPATLKLSGLDVKIDGTTVPLISGGTVTVETEPFRISQELVQVGDPTGLYTHEYLRPRPSTETKLNIRVGPFVTAKLNCWVLQYTKMDARIHAALFDSKHRLLGTAQCTEQIEYIRLGVIPSISRTLKFDFGSSSLYEKASAIAFVIEETPIPESKTIP